MRRALERARDTVSDLPGPIGGAAQAGRAAACGTGLGQAEPTEALDRPVPSATLVGATPAPAPGPDVSTAVGASQARKEGQSQEVGGGRRGGGDPRRGGVLRLRVFQRVAGEAE